MQRTCNQVCLRVTRPRGCAGYTCVNLNAHRPMVNPCSLQPGASETPPVTVQQYPKSPAVLHLKSLRWLFVTRLDTNIPTSGLSVLPHLDQPTGLKNRRLGALPVTAAYRSRISYAGGRRSAPGWCHARCRCSTPITSLPFSIRGEPEAPPTAIFCVMLPPLQPST